MLEVSLLPLGPSVQILATLGLPTALLFPAPWLLVHGISVLVPGWLLLETAVGMLCLDNFGLDPDALACYLHLAVALVEVL